MYERIECKNLKLIKVSISGKVSLTIQEIDTEHGYDLIRIFDGEEGVDRGVLRPQAIV